MISFHIKIIQHFPARVLSIAQKEDHAHCIFLCIRIEAFALPQTLHLSVSQFSLCGSPGLAPQSWQFLSVSIFLQAVGGNRTLDILLTKQAFYRLKYYGKNGKRVAFPKHVFTIDRY